jgi:hypothetical protein
MNNLFNNISQDEKNRILEMHSVKKNVISEQGTPTAKKKTPPTPIDGKTVNLYRDKGETQLLGTFKILKPVKQGNLVKIIIDNGGRTGGPSRYLEFQCGTSEPIVFLKGRNPQNFKERELKPLGLFNLKFLTALEKQYCTVSRGGKSVPKADFAMNDTQDDNTNNFA